MLVVICINFALAPCRARHGGNVCDRACVYRVAVQRFVLQLFMAASVALRIPVVPNHAFSSDQFIDKF